LTQPNHASAAERRKAGVYAFLAAAFYAVSTPVAKTLLQSVGAIVLAGLLYLGAGLGMLLLRAVRRGAGIKDREEPLGRGERKYVLAMVALDVMAPILLLAGLKLAAAANVSLLNNFEIVATTLFAWLLFQERVSGRLWAGILLVTAATAMLSLRDLDSLRFSAGSLLVLLACACWGLENNCTRMLSSKDARQIVVIKGLGSGGASLVIGLLAGEALPGVLIAMQSLALGFFSYGLSVYLYVKAQRHLGAAKTSAYYAVAPFIGALLSLALFREVPGALFWAALAVMALGTAFVNKG